MQADQLPVARPIAGTWQLRDEGGEKGGDHVAGFERTSPPSSVAPGLACKYAALLLTTAAPHNTAAPYQGPPCLGAYLGAPQQRHVSRGAAAAARRRDRAAIHRSHPTAPLASAGVQLACVTVRLVSHAPQCPNSAGSRQTTTGRCSVSGRSGRRRAANVPCCAPRWATSLRGGQRRASSTSRARAAAAAAFVDTGVARSTPSRRCAGGGWRVHVPRPDRLQKPQGDGAAARPVHVGNGHPRRPGMAPDDPR